MLSVLSFDLRIFRLVGQLVPIICQRCAYPGWLFLRMLLHLYCSTLDQPLTKPSLIMP